MLQLIGKRNVAKSVVPKVPVHVPSTNPALKFSWVEGFVNQTFHGCNKTADMNGSREEGSVFPEVVVHHDGEGMAEQSSSNHSGHKAET